jgi:hypothetical protein
MLDKAGKAGKARQEHTPLSYHWVTIKKVLKHFGQIVSVGIGVEFTGHICLVRTH